MVVVSYCRGRPRLVLVNRLEGLSLPKNSTTINWPARHDLIVDWAIKLQHKQINFIQTFGPLVSFSYNLVVFLWIFDISCDMKAVMKRNKAQLKMIQPRQDSNPGPLGQKSNALTTEPKSRLPDAVVRDWLYTQKLCMICFMQIFVTHPHFEEVIIYDDAKPIFGETKSDPGRAPILRHESRNKRNKA